MAKSLLKIVYSCIDQASKFFQSDDIRIDEEWVKDKVMDIRAVLIEEVYKSKKMIPDEFYSEPICCLPIACGPIENCTFLGESIPDPNVHYWVELPTLAGGIDWSNIKYFGLSTLQDNFNRENWTGFMLNKHARWTSQRTTYSVVGNIAYLSNLPNTGLNFLCLIGVLQDPTTACNWDEDDNYPVPEIMIQKLEMLVIKQILATYAYGIGDKVQDAESPDVQTAKPSTPNTEQ